MTTQPDEILLILDDLPLAFKGTVSMKGWEAIDDQRPTAFLKEMLGEDQYWQLREKNPTTEQLVELVMAYSEQAAARIDG